MRRRAGALLILLAIAAGATAHAQSAVLLTLAGDVREPLALDAEALRALPRASAAVVEDDRTVRYEGVLVADVLRRAGVPLGADLRGDAVATYVVATASDGYRALFSLAELDPAFTGSEVLVADTRDGHPLFAYQGPLRIVAPGDRRGARSVRMLTRLDVVRVAR